MGNYVIGTLWHSKISVDCMNISICFLTSLALLALANKCINAAVPKLGHPRLTTRGAQENDFDDLCENMQAHLTKKRAIILIFI